jgi:hypothetical protein
MERLDKSSILKSQPAVMLPNVLLRRRLVDCCNQQAQERTAPNAGI